MVSFVLACGSGGAAVNAQPETLPAPSSSTSTSSGSVAKTPAGHVQVAVARWLDWLALGEDEKFLDEAIVPSEWPKILLHESKAEFVDGFRANKHDNVVAILGKVRGATPSGMLDAGGYMRVFFEDLDPKPIVFQVVGDAVHIEE